MTEELPLTVITRPTNRDELVTALFQSDYRRLVGMARLLADGDAEEVVQESFASMYASLRRLDDPDRALAYLRSTVLNQARSRLRRKRTAADKRHLVATTGPSDPFANRIGDADAARVRQAVRRLPRRQQQCTVLRYYSDCDHHEIAETLGISAGSVKKHLHRARTTLSQNLEELA